MLVWAQIAQADVMRKNSVIFTTLGLLFSTLFLNSLVNAGDIEWSGLYRVEAYQITNSELRTVTKRAARQRL